MISDVLRKMADWLDENTEIRERACPLTIHAFASNAEQLSRFARCTGGCTKEVSDAYYYLLKDFGEGSEVRMCLSRDAVCTKRKVGVRTVTRPVLVQTGEETVTEDVFEYDCPESLLAINK